MTRYHLKELISKSSRGEIWKARDTETGDEVVIKILLVSGKDSLTSETNNIHWKALQKLEHENIARIKDTFQDEKKRNCVVMEFIPGRSLGQLIRDRIQFPFSQWVDIILQCARGLRAAYRFNLIHRDIKPSNIMLTPGGKAKIVDFGLARFFRPAIDPGSCDFVYGTNLQKKDECLIIGTPRYMSPEQCMGKVLDHRSDIYSLGATFYHCFCGKPPFEAGTCLEILEKQKMSAATPLYMLNPNVPMELSEFVQKMLEKDISRRFQDYDTLAEALEDLKLACLSRERGAGIVSRSSNSLTVHEKESPVPPAYIQAPSSFKKEKNIMYIALTLLVLLFLVSAILVSNRKSEKPENQRILISLVKKLLRQKQTPVPPKSLTLKTSISLTKQRMDKISDAIIRYHADHEKSLTDITILAKENYLEQTNLYDAWENPFQWDKEKRKIISPGPDRQMDTPDDLEMIPGKTINSNE